MFSVNKFWTVHVDDFTAEFPINASNVFSDAGKCPSGKCLETDRDQAVWKFRLSLAKAMFC